MLNLNGEILKNDEAFLEIDNRGYNYGDGLFETIRAINGEIIFWEDHYFRLMASMRILRMEIPMDFSPEILREQILKTLEANDLLQKPARVKINVHRKSGGRYKPETNEVEYAIRAWEMSGFFYTIEENACEIELFKDHFINSGLLSTLKSTNKTINVLGSIYAEENDYENCLLLNEKKMVVEALNGNLFLVSGNTIKTPPLSEGCLNGIIRKKLLEIIKKLPDFELVEEPISPFELQKADELFITNVAVGIRPVTKYRKKEFGNSTAKNLLGKLNAMSRLTPTT
jgi:branched-chain amino acid aminotransferase